MLGSILTTTLLMIAPYRKSFRQQNWLLDNGLPGTALIENIRDTKVRDSRDYFVLDVTIKIISPSVSQPIRNLSAHVSPLEFHRIGIGQEVPIRLHPDNDEVALDLPLSRR